MRFRSDVLVTSEHAETKRPAAWGSEGGRAKVLRGARVTAAGAQVGVVVCVKSKEMKEARCLATNFNEAAAQEVMDAYGRRFTLEEMLRDVKDLNFGMGLKQVRVKTPERRDRLLLVCALAWVLLGAAGEALGHDNHLKVNTAKTRTHLLFIRGSYCFMAMPRMSD